MLSFALSQASAYFHLPINEQEDQEINTYEKKYITWTPWSQSTPQAQVPSPSKPTQSDTILKEILLRDDLYDVLGIPRNPTPNRTSLRRAYLARSRTCHPDKFTTAKEEATLAFQKVAIAYDVLSTPSLKRKYDARSTSFTFDTFAARPSGYAEETLRNVVIGVFNDFLDGDLEVIRTFLKAINDVNPALNLGEAGIDTVLVALQSVRERALTCRACIYALHIQLGRVLEVQCAMRKLSYLDIFGRSRLTIQLTRIALSLPVELEKVIEERREQEVPPLLPKHLMILIRSVDVVLEKMERMMKS